MTWQPIETAPYNTDVLVVYKDLWNQRRIAIACYWTFKTLVALDYLTSGDDYDEEDDCYYCSEGWYVNVEFTDVVEKYSKMWTTPIYWMPLPVLPGDCER
jgi:hypothetical protein